MQTTNNTGMRQVSELLNKFNIAHNRYNHSPQKGAPVSIIVIGKMESRRRFIEEIGFWHSKKGDALQEALHL